MDERQKRIRKTLQEAGYIQLALMEDEGFSLWGGPENATVILAEYRQGGFEVFVPVSNSISIDRTEQALLEYTDRCKSN